MSKATKLNQIAAIVLIAGVATSSPAYATATSGAADAPSEHQTTKGGSSAPPWSRLLTIIKNII